MTFKPVIKGTRPYYEASLKKGAVASVAQATGTVSRVTFATSTVTTATLAGYVMALAADLQSRGIIQ